MAKHPFPDLYFRHISARLFWWVKSNGEIPGIAVFSTGHIDHRHAMELLRGQVAGTNCQLIYEF